LEDRRNVSRSSCNCGDGTDPRVQSMMFIMMVMNNKIRLYISTKIIIVDWIVTSVSIHSYVAPKHIPQRMLNAIFIVAPCIFKIHKLSKTKKCTNTSCIILKHTLKHLKGSYMFRSTIILKEHMQFLAEVLKC
jgi:hypothetical protein